jgi:hypothetical protein
VFYKYILLASKAMEDYPILRVSISGSTSGNVELHRYPYHTLGTLLAHVQPRYMIYRTGYYLKKSKSLLPFLKAMRPGEDELLESILRVYDKWMSSEPHRKREFMQKTKITDEDEAMTAVTGSSARTRRSRIDAKGLKRERAQFEEYIGSPSRRVEKRPRKCLGEGDYVNFNTLSTLDDMEPYQRRRRIWISEWVEQVCQEGEDPATMDEKATIERLNIE